MSADPQYCPCTDKLKRHQQDKEYNRIENACPDRCGSAQSVRCGVHKRKNCVS